MADALETLDACPMFMTSIAVHRDVLAGADLHKIAMPHLEKREIHCPAVAVHTGVLT